MFFSRVRTKFFTGSGSSDWTKSFSRARFSKGYWSFHGVCSQDIDFIPHKNCSAKKALLYA